MNINKKDLDTVLWNQPSFDITTPSSEDNKNEITYLTFLDNVNKFFKQHKDLSPSIPMSLRQQIKAQLNAKIQKKIGSCPESIRVKNCFSATIGFALTLAARIIRSVTRSLGVILSVPVAMYQQSNYAPTYSIVKEDLKRIKYEWIDLGMTFASPIIGLVNTFAPKAINLQKIMDYYVDRNQDVLEKNTAFSEAKKTYQKSAETSQKQWRNIKNPPTQPVVENATATS